MTTLERVELWSDLACVAGSARLAVLPVVSADTSEEIAGALVSRAATCAVPATWEGVPELQVGRVLRVLREDGAWREYRLTRVQVRSGPGVTVASCTAAGIEQDLALSREVLHDADGTRWTYRLDTASFSFAWAITHRVLPHLPTYWAVGTVTPTGIVLASLDTATPLAALLALTESYNAARGTRFVVDVRANGTSGYLIDVIDAGSTAPVVDLRVGGGLQGVTRTVESAGQATRAVVVGANGRWGVPCYAVAAVSTNTWIEVVDLAGGPGPAQEEDQFNGGHIINRANGLHAITDTVVISATTTRFHVASTTNIAAGDIVQLVETSGRAEYRWVDRPSLQATHGLRLGVLRVPHDEHTNWVPNADMADWTGTYPTHWTGSGTAPAKILSVFRSGGHSALLSSTTAGSLFASSRVRHYAAGEPVSIGVWLRLTAFGAGEVRFVDPNGAHHWWNIDGSVSGLDRLHEWLFWSQTYTVTTAGPKTGEVRVSPGAGVPVYVDSAQITPTSAAVSWRAGSGPASALQTANAYLEAHAAPAVAYDLSVLDLARHDPAGAGVYAALTLGGTVTVTDEALALTASTRILRIERNELLPHDTRIRAATLADPLTRTLARSV
jgi:hypothetical protein